MAAKRWLESGTHGDSAHQRGNIQEKRGIPTVPYFLSKVRIYGRNGYNLLKPKSIRTKTRVFMQSSHPGGRQDNTVFCMHTQTKGVVCILKHTYTFEKVTYCISSFLCSRRRKLIWNLIFISQLSMQHFGMMGISTSRMGGRRKERILQQLYLGYSHCTYAKHVASSGCSCIRYFEYFAFYGLIEGAKKRQRITHLELWLPTYLISSMARRNPTHPRHTSLLMASCYPAYL